MGKKGVTLVELIIVIVIVAIAATLIAPNIGAWLPYYRLRSGTRDVVSILRTAQMKAVSMNTEYQVLFDSAAKTYILKRSTQGVWVNDGVAKTLPPGILISNSFPGNSVHFNSNSTSSSGSMTLANPKGQTKKITLTSATGRIHVE